jgi:N-acyl-D-aspartate/D-glutamate deacylase
VLCKGNFADIVVFDPETVRENFISDGVPVFANGINSVLINGHPVLLNGDLIRSKRPGRVLRAS